MSNSLIRFMASCCFIGYLPLMPGTIASLGGVALYLLFFDQIHFYVILMVLIVIVGFFVCGQMEKLTQRKDPSCVVIDELAGALIALWMLPVVPKVLITAFFLFRAFDMFKIYPMNHLESWPGSIGVMMDDIIAGVYTNIMMQIAIRLVG